MQRKNFSSRPWPWELRAYLSLSDLWDLRHNEGLSATPRVFLYRTGAIKWGLLPAVESPQEAPPPPAAQSDKSAIFDSASVTSEESPGALKRGGRPTDRERIMAEARRRLSAEDAKEIVPRQLAVFCEDLRKWLNRQLDPIRNSKTGEVMSVDTIEEHVRDMFWEFSGRPENR